MHLRMGNGIQMEPAVPAELEAALATLEPEHNGTAVLWVEEDVYLQTAMDREGFIIERRDGHAGLHMRAFRAKPHPVMVNDHFDRAEMVEMFDAYLLARPMPESVRWETLTLAPPRLASAGTTRLLIYGLGALLLVIALGIALAGWWR